MDRHELAGKRVLDAAIAVHSGLGPGLLALAALRETLNAKANEARKGKCKLLKIYFARLSAP
jgi:hypothetical protein